MLEDDVYKTISGPAEGTYTERRSRFLAFAFPIQTEDEFKEHLDEFKKEYYNARHICYAYMLGHEREDFRANDDGEPSGTAGRPILGQINSNELTDILIIVVRFYGGIKLGTGGLIVAYRTAAAAAIEEAKIIKKTVDKELFITFEYPCMNDVMRIVKEEEPDVIEQNFEMDCSMRLRIRVSKMERLKKRLSIVESVAFPEEEQVDEESTED